jgi:hypothetical protein
MHRNFGSDGQPLGGDGEVGVLLAVAGDGGWGSCPAKLYFDNGFLDRVEAPGHPTGARAGLFGVTVSLCVFSNQRTENGRRVADIMELDWDGGQLVRQMPLALGVDVPA